MCDPGYCEGGGMRKGEAFQRASVQSRGSCTVDLSPCSFFYLSLLMVRT